MSNNLAPPIVLPNGESLENIGSKNGKEESAGEITSEPMIGLFYTPPIASSVIRNHNFPRKFPCQVEN